jgi:hypothetical protein
LRQVRSEKKLNSSLRDSSIPQHLTVMCLFTLVLGAIACFLIPVRFETNDDVCMELIAAGIGFLRQPDPHILFTHIWIGKTLSFLYNWKVTFPWYAFYLEVCNFAAVGVLGFCLALKHPRSRALIFTGLFFFASAIHAVVLLQFTFTACLLALAGTALLVTACDTSSKNPRLNFFFSMSGFVFLLISSLVRYASFQLICLLAILLFCLVPVATVALALLAGNGLYRLNSSSYAHDEGWSDFYAMNSAMAEFIDFGRATFAEKRPDLLKEAGWTTNDLHMLLFWGNVDTKLYTTSKMNRLCAQLPAVTKSRREIRRQLVALVTDPALLPVYCLLIIAALSTRKGKLATPRFTLLALACVGLMVAMAVLLKINPRTYLPVFSFLLYFGLYHSAPLNFMSFLSLRSPHRVVAISIISIVSMTYLAWAAQEYYYPALQWNVDSRQLNQRVNALERDPRTLYVAWGDSFPYEYIPPFCDLPSYLEGLQLLPIGGQSQSPTVQKILDYHHIPDLFPACLQPDIFLISSEVENDILQKYMQEHYGIDIAFQKMFDGLEGDRMVVFKCERKSKGQ